MNLTTIKKRKFEFQKKIPPFSGCMSVCLYVCLSVCDQF